MRTNVTSQSRPRRNPTHPVYRYALLDPRPIEEAKEYNQAIFTQGTVWGVEVTVPELASRCQVNLDPQHSDGNAELAAIEAALTVKPPEAGTTLVTVLPDLDSVGGMAVLTLRKQGATLGKAALGRIKIIAMSDKFKRGPWPGRRPLPHVNQLTDDHVAGVEDHSFLAAIAAATGDVKRPLAERVALLQDWILTGKEPAGYRGEWVRARMALAKSISEREISCRLENTAGQDVAVVESPHRAPTGVGYHLAPVVVARTSEYYFQGHGPLVKYTICQWPDREYVDLCAVFDELNQREDGWGGSPFIGGSPQGVSSKLSTGEILEVVAKHVRR